MTTPASSIMGGVENIDSFSQESDDDEVDPPPKRFRKNSFDDANLNSSSLSHEHGWKAWTSEILAEKLTEAGLKDVAGIFKKQEIAGWMLPKITKDDLDKYGISKLGRKLQVLQFIENLMTESKMASVESRKKVFNDPIHGHMEFHPLCVSIIDTLQFQRLRFLKQLGSCYFVYPGASHNRFEHSLGVCHLAGQLVRSIKRRQPELDITDADVLCVEIAGLCHDLGHGPFSHLFDGKFIPQICPDSKWRHEDASRMMFRYLINDNKLQPLFEEEGLSPQDIMFIEELFAGPKKDTDGKDLPYEGRPEEKSFLYEIVANKRNGIDVDKWDYFARDCHNLGMHNNFDHVRCIHFARVLEVDKQLQICFREKEVDNLYDMFQTRYVLHRRAYQHKTASIIDIMLVEALIKANDHIKFTGANGKELRMSEAIKDKVAYSRLTDDIFSTLLNSTDPKLEESKIILGNIMQRNLYKCVGQTQLTERKEPIDTEKAVGEIMSEMDPCTLTKEDIIIDLVKLNYGMKTQNPIDNVHFYSKEDPNVAHKLGKTQVSYLLPETFAEQQIRVYCKIVDPRTLALVKQAFHVWCSSSNLPTPKTTPVKSQPKNTIQNRDEKAKDKLSFNN